MKQAATRRKHRWLYAGAILLAVLAAIGFIYLRPYEPDARAAAALNSGGDIRIVNGPDWISFVPEKRTEPSVIWYPGGLVKPESYAPMARALAWTGHAVYVVKMPLHLAVLGGERALPLIEGEPDADFVIGGHSLGGVMASRFAAKHPQLVRGVFFLGSYPDPQGALTGAGLPVLSVTGSLDGVLNREKYEQARSLLPASTQYAELEGGNHAQFGSYGPQKGDQAAALTPDAQQLQLVEMMAAWLGQIK
ncbi:Alpha/beta hydrolase family protein [Paenibacillus sp. UNCCL117]|uniref:alpha/beta fold hydrolase n=1 Tax=unclassified Paenibacillus TaxID=185978 RepID=UPI00088DD2A8|nr:MULTISPECIES: alpha/beta fold hydrolase [unclassified Paenibacillus]SDD76127.1 Alpha/beta hydrolase family protein [Paenibacillus sp. cl123]SFW52356.1 Alpha/beta hydrolase family protein [Paenibacillus sp. UNCCL117]